MIGSPDYLFLRDYTEQGPEPNPSQTSMLRLQLSLLRIHLEDELGTSLLEHALLGSTDADRGVLVGNSDGTSGSSVGGTAEVVVTGSNVSNEICQHD